MLVTGVFYCGVLLYGTGLSLALHVPHGQQLMPAQDPQIRVEGHHHTPSSTESGDGLGIEDHIPLLAPCFVDDIFAALLESVGDNGELTDHSLSLFGTCTSSDHSSGSVLVELVADSNGGQRNRIEDCHPVGVLFSEDEESGTLTLTVDLPPSATLKSNPVLLLAFERPLTERRLGATFAGQSLQPNTQSVCISGDTQYIILTGALPEANARQKWTISVDTKSPDTRQTLKNILVGGMSGSNIRMTPLLFFTGWGMTDTRYTLVPGSFPASAQTSSFLCGLKRFLADVMPQAHLEFPPLQLSSLQSQPPLTLGLSSSEALLSGLINSSTLTVFSFTSCCSMSQVHHGELALSAGLLEELRQGLQQTVEQITAIIKEEKLGPRATERLGRLMELSSFSKKELAAGESQYRAFLLFKALQTVARMHEAKRGMRVTRADAIKPVRGYPCRLRSLVMSLERLAVGPNFANIKNCHGSCAFPLANPSTHAVLLNSYIENENAAERAPCCVPVAYEDMHMVLLNAEGTGTVLKTLKNVVAKECGCR